MHVALFRADNFRSYRHLKIRPSSKLNFLIGPNAAGKTTLLEGLSLAGRARSFRTNNLGELAGVEGACWNTYLEIENGAGRSDKASVSWKPEGMTLRLNGERARSSDLARLLPQQIIDPTAHRLVDEGPGFRRGYIDWGVFHVEHDYHFLWQRYQRCLKQRNQALRLNLAARSVQAWDEEMATAAWAVTEARNRHVEALSSKLPMMAEQLLGETELQIELKPGWPAHADYRQLLADQLVQHRQQGTTSIGPHRAEVKLLIRRRSPKGHISRGQQKLLVATLVLAQCETLIDAGVPPPVVLLDDFAAELSPLYQHRLASALLNYKGQVFSTAFELPDSFNKGSVTVFHVEHGNCQRRDDE